VQYLVEPGQKRNKLMSRSRPLVITHTATGQALNIFFRNRMEKVGAGFVRQERGEENATFLLNEKMASSSVFIARTKPALP
jgi:hypothetical protein